MILSFSRTQQHTGALYDTNTNDNGLFQLSGRQVYRMYPVSLQGMVTNVSVAESNVQIRTNSSGTASAYYTIYKGKVSVVGGDSKDNYAGIIYTRDLRVLHTSYSGVKNPNSTGNVKFSVTNIANNKSVSFVPYYRSYISSSDTDYFLLLRRNLGDTTFSNYNYGNDYGNYSDPYVYVLFCAYEDYQTFHTIEFAGRIVDGTIKIGQKKLTGNEKLESSTLLKSEEYEISTNGCTFRSRDNYGTTEVLYTIRDKNVFDSFFNSLNAPTEVKTVTMNLRYYEYLGRFKTELYPNPTLTYKTYDDTTYTYFLEKKSEDVKIYVGQPYPDSLFNSIKLVQERHNQFISQPNVDYKMALTRNDLNVDSEPPTVNTTSVTFTYKGTDVVVDEPLTIQITPIKLFANDNKFGLVLKTSYDLGDTFSFEEIINQVKNNGVLYYEDGTSLRISDYLDYFEITISESTLEDGTVITPETTPLFNYKINFSSSVFGNFTYNASAVIGAEELQVVSAELVNYKGLFKYGETIIFGNDAQILLKNADGDILKTIPNGQIKTNLSVLDVNYNKVINEENIQFLTDEEIILTSTLKDYDLQIVQKIKVSYPKEAEFNYSAVKKIQYWLPEEFDTFKFDLTGIKVLVEYHDNSVTPTNIYTAERDVTVVGGVGLTSNVNTKEYRIELSYTYDNRLFTNNGLVITAEKVRPVAIIIDNENAEENATSYWDSGEAFKYPNGFTFKVQYNAIKEDENKNYSELTYYWNGNALNVGQTILKQYDSVGNQNPTTIEVRYYYQVDTYVSGTFSITWRENSISSVDINSTDPISLTLGNSLNTLKSLFSIRITYKDLSVVDGYQDYSFQNGNTILMSEPSSIVVIVKENGENKEWTLSKNKYTFIKPKVNRIVLDTTNVATVVNNGIDAIDLTNLNVKVFYTNAEYIGEITTYKYLESSESLEASEFSASNTTLGTSFKYDGSSIANIVLESEEVEKTLPLTISIVNAFGVVEGDTINSTILNVRVVEITNITGLSIERAFEDYYIGDKFLDDSIETNENCTQVWVWYLDGKDVQRRILVDLKDNLKSLNIFPRPNTIFYTSERNKTIRVSAATNPTVYVEYTINVEPKYVQSDTTQIKDIVAVYNRESYELPNGSTISGKYLLVDENNTQVINGVRSLNTSLSWKTIKVYGYLEDIGDRTKNARVILFEDYIPPIDGQSNIVCEFPCYVKGNAEKIDKCTIGHLFGNNNAKNRLFVSGNPDVPNCDWHSGAINTSKQEGDVANENGDFTYFEDTSYCFYGQTDNHIVGYDIVSNDRLVVLKSKSDKEPTIYYRTSGLVQAVNGSGSNVVGLNNEALYEEQYPLSIGNIGTGALSNRAIINFNGDTLFMSSDKELDGLDVTGIIGDSQRYAYSRSKYIDPVFKKINLDNVSLWTNQKYLFLITQDEVYLTHYETYNSETRQYEWWRYDLKDVQVLIEIDNKIYFGNSEGELFTLDTDIYADKDKIFIREGATSLATLDETNDTIAVADSIINKLEDGVDYTFRVNPKYDGEGNIDYTSCLFYQIAYINNSKAANNGNIDLFVNTEYNAIEIVALRNGEFDTDLYETLVNKIDENIDYFLNYSNNGNNDYSIGASSNSIFKSLYTPYRLKLVEDTYNTDNLCFAIYDKDGNRLDVRELYYANLVACLDKEYKITEIDREEDTFRVLDQNEMKVDIVRYGDQDTLHALSGEISKYSNVKAYYVSAPFTLGDLMYNKTVRSWTLTNDTKMDSYLEVCEATNDIDFEEMKKVVALNITHGYNLNKFAFNKINFGKSVIPYKYTFIRPLLVPFICFGFKNNENSNAVLCAMQINYSKPSLSFGKGK